MEEQQSCTTYTSIESDKLSISDGLGEEKESEQESSLETVVAENTNVSEKDKMVAENSEESVVENANMSEKDSIVVENPEASVVERYLNVELK